MVCRELRTEGSETTKLSTVPFDKLRVDQAETVYEATRSDEQASRIFGMKSKTRK